MATAPDGRKMVEPKNRAAWRKWLAANHATSDPIWLVYRKKAARKPGDLTYDEAVEEALCHGWIDSTVNRLDDERTMQSFSRRKPMSIWSKTNKERVERLTAAGQMQPSGLALVEAAKSSGMWAALDAVDNLEIPPDLARALRSTKDAKKNFDAFSDSSKKSTLWWIMSAKRAETRAKRIAETVRLASKGKRAGL